jgi:branched-chain amino acid transport system ATP-binding protein
MAAPDVILLDEPSEGLAPAIVQTLLSQIHLLKDRGVTMLLAEQNLALTSSVSDRVYLIERGEIRFEGKPQQVLDDPELRSRYLAV